MGKSDLRGQAPEGNQELRVEGGFAQMVDNRLTILAEQARKAE